jgi:capsular polysaccharide transport system permease protein
MPDLENRRDLSLVDALRTEGGETVPKGQRTRRAAAVSPESAAEGRKSQISNDVGPVQADAEELRGRQRARGRDDSPEPGSVPTLRALVPETPPEVAEPLVLPQRQRGTVRIGGIVSFVLCVALPTILAAVYYIWFASDQYVVEWRYAVRDSSTATSTSAAASAMTSLLGTSTSASVPENYMVTEYIKSEQAVIDLEKRIGLRSLYSRPSIDFLSRFDDRLPVERLVRYWENMISASYDSITGTAGVEIRAFTPQDAYLIATTLIDLTEDLVNEVAQRPQREAVRYAEAEVARAEERLRKVRADLTEYRNKASVIEPNSGVVLSNATVATTLRQTISQYQSDLGNLIRGGLSQDAAQVQALRRRITAVQDQLRQVESEIAKSGDGNQPLAQVVGRYEELDLERQFAQALLTSTVQSLEQARSNAVARRLFILPFVRPALPESSTYPKRLVAILTVAGASAMLWTIALLIGRSIREHLA